MGSKNYEIFCLSIIDLQKIKKESVSRNLIAHFVKLSPKNQRKLIKIVRNRLLIKHQLNKKK